MTPIETLTFPRITTRADIAGGEKVCPVCAREVQDEFVPLPVVDEELQKLICANAHDTQAFEVVCARCLRLFEHAKDNILSDAAMTKDGSHVLSTPLRLDAVPLFTGRGVTIAFLDSGFYPHDDLTLPVNRILAYQNMNAAEGEIASLFQNDAASWHGMMTSVVAAGNGLLSKLCLSNWRALVASPSRIFRTDLNGFWNIAPNTTFASSTFRRAAILSRVIYTIRFHRRLKNASPRESRSFARSETPDICRRIRSFRLRARPRR